MSIKTKLVYKQRHKDKIEGLILGKLLESYPNAFFSHDSIETKPLKVGIFRDIFRERNDIGGRILGQVLDKYTQSYGYLRSLISKPNRVDLNGNVVGEVADHHRQFAIDTLIKRQQENLAKKAA
jgi:ProP effector